MILEQIDKELLAMAEESDSVLKDIYQNMIYVYIIQIESYPHLLKIKYLTLILRILTVMETMMKDVTRLKRSSQVY